jgi:hypothetical protein
MLFALTKRKVFTYGALNFSMKQTKILLYICFLIAKEEQLSAPILQPFHDIFFAKRFYIIFSTFYTHLLLSLLHATHRGTHSTYHGQPPCQLSAIWRTNSDSQQPACCFTTKSKPPCPHLTNNYAGHHRQMGISLTDAFFKVL